MSHLPAHISLRLFVAVAVWLVVVALGVGVLWQFAAQPGSEKGPARQWPEGSQLMAARDRPTLVVFAHPKCPCTRATLAELARLLARSKDRVETHVVFVRPLGSAAGWERTDLWDSAAAIPGVAVAVDPEGAEARRFGATTSGYTLLYGTDGHLQFSGGITGSRGHAGDNPGEDAIISLLTTGRSDRVKTPAFGCALLNEA